MTQQMIAVASNSPGAGKTTLCEALARRLAAAGGLETDHFAEEEVLTRPVFAQVADEFAGGAGSVRPETLVDGLRRYVEVSRQDGLDVLLTDALFPFIPSLVAWGHDEETIAAVVAAAARAISPTQITVVYLREDPATALARAVDREGQQWGQWYVDKLARWPGTRHVRDLESAADHLRWETDLTLRVLDGTPCRVITVDVHGRTATEVERDVLARAADLVGDAEAGCGR